MHRHLVPVLMVAVLTAGCSWLAVPTPTPSAGGGIGGDPGAGKPIGGGGVIVQPDPNGAQRDVPDPTVVDARPTAIDHWAIGPDGRTVVVYYWGGNMGCFGLHSITVEARDGVPVITVMEGTRAAAVGQACTMEALLKSAVVTLDAPVLRDAAGEQEAGEPFLAATPQLVTPVAGVQNPMAHAVSGYRLSTDGVSLTVHYVGGTDECYALAEASAVPGDDGILVVTIREGTLPNAGPCDDIGVAKAVVITLNAPLLVDGSRQ